MIALWLLLASSAHADALRLTLRVEDGHVALVYATETLDDVPSSAGAVPSSTGDVAVLDAHGELLATTALPTVATHRSVLLPDGHQTARLDDRYVRVTVPWPTGAHALRVDGDVVPIATDPRLRRAPVGTPAEPVLQSGPSDRRLDLLFLAEGYTADREDAFEASVDAVVDHLLTVEPWSAYTGLLNVWRVFVPADEHGVDDPFREIEVDSPFDCAYGCGQGTRGLDRLICCDEAAVLDVVDATAPFADGVMVLVDDTQYGGSGGQSYSVSYAGGDETSLLVATHELGHTLAGLWDEYPYGTAADPDVRYTSPNCGPVDVAVPWGAWLDGGPIDWPSWHAAQSEAGEPACDGRPGSHAADAVCAFAACSFSDYVRPTREACMMNVLGGGYCPVCREAVVRALYQSTGGELVVDADPPAGTLVVVPKGGSQAFHVDTIGPDDGLTWTWTHDDEVVHTGPDLVLDEATPVCGTLTLTLTDPTTWLRTDPDDLLSDTISWNVRSGRCCGCATGTSTSAIPALLFALALVPRRRR